MFVLLLCAQNYKINNFLLLFFYVLYTFLSPFYHRHLPIMSMTGVGSTHMDHFVQQKKNILCEMQAGLKVPL